MKPSFCYNLLFWRLQCLWYPMSNRKSIHNLIRRLDAMKDACKSNEFHWGFFSSLDYLFISLSSIRVRFFLIVLINFSILTDWKNFWRLYSVKLHMFFFFKKIGFSMFVRDSLRIYVVRWIYICSKISSISLSLLRLNQEIDWIKEKYTQWRKRNTGK